MAYNSTMPYIAVDHVWVQGTDCTNNVLNGGGSNFPLVEVNENDGTTLATLLDNKAQAYFIVKYHPTSAPFYFYYRGSIINLGNGYCIFEIESEFSQQRFYAPGNALTSTTFDDIVTTSDYQQDYVTKPTTIEDLYSTQISLLAEPNILYNYYEPLTSLDIDFDTSNAVDGDTIMINFISDSNFTYSTLNAVTAFNSLPSNFFIELTAVYKDVMGLWFVTYKAAPYSV